ncbi:MAG: ABC transporter permease [Armatimonadota bacterium]
MEAIGRQVTLPFKTALQISLQGIRIRLGRALVTISGVVLGIAFLMNILTGELIKRTTAAEQDFERTLKLMTTLVNSEIGDPAGKNIALLVSGTTTAADQALLKSLLAGKPARVNASGYQGAGVTPVELSALGKGADVLIVLGDGAVQARIADLFTGMRQRVILDSKADRTYQDTHIPKAARLELFFGEQSTQEQESLEEKARQAHARTIWVVTISLLVTVIGITNALLMSVTERFKEIGTMKCLGALSGFIRQLFLIESALIGFVGSVLGILVGVLFPIVLYGGKFGFKLVFSSLDVGGLLVACLASLLVGTLLSILAAIYPANIASRMVPASALRSNV